MYGVLFAYVIKRTNHSVWKEEEKTKEEGNLYGKTNFLPAFPSISQLFSRLTNRRLFILSSLNDEKKKSNYLCSVVLLKCARVFPLHRVFIMRKWTLNEWIERKPLWADESKVNNDCCGYISVDGEVNICKKYHIKEMSCHSIVRMLIVRLNHLYV